MKRSHVWIGILICLMFISVIVALFKLEPPARAMEPLLILIGALSAAFGAVVNYWFGSSSGSARKDELMAGAAPSGGAALTTKTTTTESASEPPKA